VTLRDDLLPVFDYGRTLIDDLGLRTTRVILRTRTWDEGQVGLGELTEVDVELEPRPKVREKRPGFVEVGPITPEYAAGGYAPDAFDPPLTAGQELVWILIGPDGAERPYRWAETDSRRAFRYVFQLESLDRQDPDF
jgi:hypothetical protein